MDDVGKNHIIDVTGRKVTQSIIFKDSTTVDLKCRYTLMPFCTSKPNQQEITNLPIYNIVMDDWDPQRYYDWINDDLSIMSSQDSGEHNQHIVNSSVVTNSSYYQNMEMMKFLWNFSQKY